MGSPRIPSIFRPSSTSSSSSASDTHGASPARTPSHESTSAPKSRGLGVLGNLPRLFRRKASVTSESPGASSSRTPQISSPEHPLLTRQNARGPQAARSQDAASPAAEPMRRRPPPQRRPVVRPPTRPPVQQEAAPLRTPPARAAAGASSSASTPAFTSGPTDKRHIALHALSPEIQDALLDNLDPVRTLGLTDATVLYRSTHKSWLQNIDGKPMLGGNPESVATINNYHVLRPNTIDPITLRMMPPEMRDDPAMKYAPTKMRANELPVPTLNVMHGARAHETAAYGEGSKNHVLVSMTLGDLRKAGGGQVFRDVDSAAGGASAVPLIVTLPEGALVPVKIGK